MILADTLVWVDHFRSGDPTLGQLLQDRRIVQHPYVIGELAMGNLPDRPRTLVMLEQLARVETAHDNEVMQLVGSRSLHGKGLSWIGAHLLASALISPHCRWWSRDRRLNATAFSLGVGAQMHH